MKWRKPGGSQHPPILGFAGPVYSYSNKCIHSQRFLDFESKNIKYIYIYVYVCTYVRTYVRMYVCMYVFLYIYMYLHIFLTYFPLPQFSLRRNPWPASRTFPKGRALPILSIAPCHELLFCGHMSPGAEPCSTNWQTSESVGSILPVTRLNISISEATTKRITISPQNQVFRMETRPQPRTLVLPPLHGRLPRLAK